MMKRRAKVDYARWVFVLPALLVVGILLIYPIFSSLYYSMTTKHLIRLTYDFIGLENYKAVLADPNFFKAFLNSVLWTLGSLAGQLIIGFTGALAINRVNFGKGIYRTLMIIPWAFPSIVIALSWKWILNGVSGFIPNILVQLGICNELPQFLSDNSFVFLTLIFINIWFGAPMIMVNVLSALQTIPQDQYEAAQIDGASKVQQFWYITVPHIKVVVGLLVVLRTIWVFNNFDIIYLLTGGGPANATTTMPIYAYNMGWNTKLLGRSSAVTTSLDALIDEDNSVRVIDAYVDSLDLIELGFKEYSGTNRGQAPYRRSDLLKLHIYGYLNKIRSSRSLEIECKRNLELMWLINAITPDHGTIAGFVKNNRKAFHVTLRNLTLILKGWGLIDGKLIAIDGTKIRAQNSKHNCITKSGLDKKIAYADEQINAYLMALEKDSLL